MRPPLRFTVYEILKEKKFATDDEILKEKKFATDEEILSLLGKTDAYSMHELNKALLDLEILGTISVRWAAKEKRRIELVEGAAGPVRYGE